MLRNLWHKTAPLTLVCMLSVKVKSSYDTHLVFFSINSNNVCLILFHLLEFIRLKIHVSEHQGSGSMKLQLLSVFNVASS